MTGGLVVILKKVDDSRVNKAPPQHGSFCPFSKKQGRFRKLTLFLSFEKGSWDVLSLGHATGNPDKTKFCCNFSSSLLWENLLLHLTKNLFSNLVLQCLCFSCFYLSIQASSISSSQDTSILPSTSALETPCSPPKPSKLYFSHQIWSGFLFFFKILA